MHAVCLKTNFIKDVNAIPSPTKELAALNVRMIAPVKVSSFMIMEIGLPNAYWLQIHRVRMIARNRRLLGTMLEILIKMLHVDHTCGPIGGVEGA